MSVPLHSDDMSSLLLIGGPTTPTAFVGLYYSKTRDLTKHVRDPVATPSLIVD
jgi:hypothetical protein